MMNLNRTGKSQRSESGKRESGNETSVGQEISINRPQSSLLCVLVYWFDVLLHGFQPDFPAGAGNRADRDPGAARAARRYRALRTCAACSGPRSTTTPRRIWTRSSGPSSSPVAAYAC